MSTEANLQIDDELSIIREADLRKMLCLSHSTFWRMRREGRFPNPISLGVRARGWTRESIRRWIEEKTGNESRTTS